MLYRIASFVLIACILCFVGCSNKVKMHGTVKFSDGAPLEKGTLFFSDGMQMFQGEIRPDGTFEIGEIQDGDGIPPGNYKAWLAANTLDYEVDPVTKQPTGKTIRTILIDPKFEDRETSGLSFVVETGRNQPIEIVVEKP